MTDLYDVLSRTDKPVVMYGMGNGADKILKVLSERGIAVSDFFASDGFVRGHFFHGKKVLTYAQVSEKYDDFTVLVAFGSSLEDVAENVRRIARERELYIPDVPVCGENIFDKSFYNSNSDEIMRARSCFADERSREVFDLIIEYKLTGRADILEKSVDSDGGDSLLDYRNYGVICDAGAYNGDTARKFIRENPNVKKIYALEPDRRSFRKLSEYAGSEKRVIPLNIGAWDKEESVSFRSQGNRNSGIGDGDECAFASIDAITAGDTVDLIKYDVEGAELQALTGSKRTISRCRPSLYISAYHRSEDIFTLPLFIARRYPFYSMYLRKKPGFPAWDIDLICLPDRVESLRALGK